MDSRQKICRSKCEDCPFASCNFNPAFIDINLILAETRKEAAYSDADRFAWVELEKASDRR